MGWQEENEYVGKVLSIGQVIDSDKTSWEKWCDELTEFVSDDEEELEPKKASLYNYSWINTFKFLKSNFPKTIESRDYPLLFEYRPPLRNGRRMDVVILLDTKEIVLEFKATAKYSEEEMLQLNRYVHYLKTSHNVTIQNHLEVEGYLVRTKDDGAPIKSDIGTVLNKSNFTQSISKSMAGHKAYASVKEWVNSETTTIPSIPEAMIKLFREKEKQEIQYLLDGDLGKSLPFLNGLIKKTQEEDEKTLIVVDGVPGSGKTYLGMEVLFDEMQKHTPPTAVYISGNAPLINYMNTIFSPENSEDVKSDSPNIMEIKTFKKEYIFEHTGGQTPYRTPKYNVIVFDEAQRMWDEKSMQKDYSEIEGMLQLGDRTKEAVASCVIVCLYGTGQVIFRGEEDGPRIWKQAIDNHPDWNYYASPEIVDEFDEAGNINPCEELHLSTSIRNNYINISPWIESLIENQSTDEQKKLLNQAKKEGFFIYVTRHLSEAKSFMEQENTTSYGVITSSFVSSNDLSRITDGMIHSSYLNANHAGKWFISECKNLNIAASEFVCQGLELDWPLVLFGEDFYRKDGEWCMEIPRKKRVDLENPEEILKNIYRVLLSRGREGLIIIIPEEEKMEETYKLFYEDLGIMDLKEITVETVETE